MWAYINCCGFCVNGSSGLYANAEMPCMLFLSLSLKGHAKKDRCGIIYGGTSGRLQTPNEYPCPPILYPPSSNITIIPITVGPCFEGNNSVYYYPDCADECNGTAVINDCLEGVGGSTGPPPSGSGHQEHSATPLQAQVGRPEPRRDTGGARCSKRLSHPQEPIPQPIAQGGTRQPPASLLPRKARPSASSHSSWPRSWQPTPGSFPRFWKRSCQQRT